MRSQRIVQVPKRDFVFVAISFRLNTFLALLLKGQWMSHNATFRHRTAICRSLSLKVNEVTDMTTTEQWRWPNK